MAFWHWLNVEIWTPMWPNVFAPNLWSLLAIGFHLVVTMVQRTRQHKDAERRADERHEDLKKHITSVAGGTDGTTEGDVPGQAGLAGHAPVPGDGQDG